MWRRAGLLRPPPGLAPSVLSPASLTLRGLKELKLLCCPFSALTACHLVKDIGKIPPHAQEWFVSSQRLWARWRLKIHPSGLQNDSVFLPFLSPHRRLWELVNFPTCGEGPPLHTQTCLNKNPGVGFSSLLSYSERRRRIQVSQAKGHPLLLRLVLLYSIATWWAFHPDFNPPITSCSTLGQLWVRRTLNFEPQSAPLASPPHPPPPEGMFYPQESSHDTLSGMWKQLSWSPCLFFCRPKVSHPTNLLHVTWFQVPSATALLLPCHLQTFFGLQGTQSLAILLTLPSPVISPNQLFSCLFLFSWPCSWQIDTDYKLTQLQ